METIFIVASLIVIGTMSYIVYDMSKHFNDKKAQH